MKISGTYQPIQEDTGDDDEVTEVTEHAPLPETADDNSNSVKCEDNNQHEIINTNPEVESMLFVLQSFYCELRFSYLWWPF